MSSKVTMTFNDFPRLAHATKDHFADVAEEVANNIASNIKQSMGTTAKVRIRRRGTERIIEAGPWWLGFMEYGTRYQPAQGKVTHSAESERSSFTSKLAELERSL